MGRIAILFLVLAAAIATAQEPADKLFKLTDGLPSAENMLHTRPGVLFVSDMAAGNIYKLSWTPGKMKEGVKKEVWITGFKSCTGFSALQFYDEFFFYALCENGTNMVLAVSADVPQHYAIFSAVPKVQGNYSWNGFALAERTGYMYVTNLGNFQPGAGSVSIVGYGGSLQTFASNLSSADGAWVDERAGLLYVSEAFAAMVHVFSLRVFPPKELKAYKAPNMTSLDDMMVYHGQYILGADYNAGKVIKFNVDGSGVGATIASGFQHTTCIRPAFEEGGVFITDTGAGAVWFLKL